jgi:SAM-dependent methyltransferase
MTAGNNVDIVLKDPYEWNEIDNESADFIISGQCLEHVSQPWTWMQQLALKLKPKGIAIIIAPSQGPQHRFPVDCYRYLPDGMRSLCDWSLLTVIETFICDKNEKWQDCVLVATKQDTNLRLHRNANVKA